MQATDHASPYPPARRSHVDRVVLVNPATSFPQSAWPAAGPLLSALPDAAYKLLPFAIMPLIGNPVAMALAGVNLAQPTPAALSDAAYSAVRAEHGIVASLWCPCCKPLVSMLQRVFVKLQGCVACCCGGVVSKRHPHQCFAMTTPLYLQQRGSVVAAAQINMLPELAALRVVLPADTLQWKLQLLRTGSTAIEPRLPEVQQRVLLVAGENDLLIPSAEEAKRLARKLPRCNTRVLPGRSHALLQEAGVDLVSILKEEGFYVTERRLSNAGFRKAPRAGSGSSGGVGGSGAGSSSTSSGYDATTSGSSSSTGAVVYAGATVAAAAVAEAEVVGKLNGNGTSHDTIASSASISEPHSERVAAHSGAGDSGPASTSGGGRSGANFGTAAPLELPTKQVRLSAHCRRPPTATVNAQRAALLSAPGRQQHVNHASGYCHAHICRRQPTSSPRLQSPVTARTLTMPSTCRPRRSSARRPTGCC